jgi:hypothetical protein
MDRTCENCGKSGESDRMINIIITIGSPGHPSLMPFQCDKTEHWSCSIDCFEKVGHACISEDMKRMLLERNEVVKNKNA